MNNIDLDALLQAGQIHKTIKQQILPMIKPDIKIYDISRKIASLTRELSNNNQRLANQVNGGMPFTPSISVNHIVCHHSPLNNNDILNNNDNVKIDYGVHIDGWIVDSAFSFGINNHNVQNKVTLEALMSGIKEIGIDAPISNVSRAIQEIVESTEVEHNNNIHHLKLVNGLGGHGIKQFNLHAAPRIDNIYTSRNREFNSRFKEGIFAVEPLTCILNPCFTYTSNTNIFTINKPNPKLYKLFRNFTFTDDDLKYYNIPQEEIEYYINNKIIVPEKDLVGTPGDIISHFEHTVYLDENKKILLT
jgi:methionine aminopeptidase